MCQVVFFCETSKEQVVLQFSFPSRVRDKAATRTGPLPRPPRPAKRAAEPFAQRPQMATSGHHHPPGDGAGSQDINEELFTDLMMGQALALYIDKDVKDREKVLELVEVCLLCTPTVNCWADWRVETWRRGGANVQYRVIYSRSVYPGDESSGSVFDHFSS